MEKREDLFKRNCSSSCDLLSDGIEDYCNMIQSNKKDLDCDKSCCMNNNDISLDNLIKILMHYNDSQTDLENSYLDDDDDDFEIKEYTKNSVFVIEMPANGGKKDDFNVTVNKDEGTISIKGNLEKETHNGYLKHSINVIRTLPKGIDYSSMKCDVVDGVFKIAGYVEENNKYNNIITL